MGNFMVCRISCEGKIEEFYYNSYNAAVEALNKWEADNYWCQLYAKIPAVR